MDIWADPSALVAQDVGLGVLAFCNCGLESSPGHGFLFLVNVASCQVEVPATGRSLVQRSPTECGVSDCDLETSAKKQHRPTRVVKPQNKVYICSVPCTDHYRPQYRIWTVYSLFLFHSLKCLLK